MLIRIKNYTFETDKLFYIKEEKRPSPDKTSKLSRAEIESLSTLDKITDEVLEVHLINGEVIIIKDATLSDISDLLPLSF